MSMTLCNLYELARQLRLSRRWLKAEADAGRIPCLKAGRRRLFNLHIVERVLAQRAAEIPPAARQQEGQP